MVRTARSASGAALNTGIRLDPDRLAKLDRLARARSLSRSELVARLLDRVNESDIPPRAEIPGQMALVGPPPDPEPPRRTPVPEHLQARIDANARRAAAERREGERIVACDVYRTGRHVVGANGRCKGCGMLV